MWSEWRCMKQQMLYDLCRSLAPQQLAASRAYWIGDWCLALCLCVIKLFKLLLLQFFSDSHKTWHTRSIRKKNWNRFSKFFSVSVTTAAELSRPTGLPSFIWWSGCTSLQKIPSLRYLMTCILAYVSHFYRAMHVHKCGICCHPVSVCHVRELRQNE